MKVSVLMLCVGVLGAACGEAKTDGPTGVGKENKPPVVKAPTSAAETPVDPSAVAYLMEVDGTVEVIRSGEAKPTAAVTGDSLREGDQVRAAAGASATIALADETVVEVAELSTVAIGDRSTSGAPASSVAVLSGAARFSVSGRAEGEGAFLVFTPGGVVATKGTVFTVNVAATAETQIGVETGEVEVAGHANLEAPVPVAGGFVATIAAEGTAGAPAELEPVKAAEWRATTDASLDPKLVIEAHGVAMTKLQTELDAELAALATLQNEEVAFEAKAAAAEKAADPKAYVAVQAEGAANIEATYHVALRVQRLTWALNSRAALATELSTRGPAAQAAFQAVAPKVTIAATYPARLVSVGKTQLLPLRGRYHLHHPVGRKHAKAAGVVVPPFYASIEPMAPPGASVKAKARFPYYAPPVVAATAKDRVVFIAGPPTGWKGKLKVTPAAVGPKSGWRSHGAQGQLKGKGHDQSKPGDPGQPGVAPGTAAGELKVDVRNPASQVEVKGPDKAKIEADIKAMEGTVKGNADKVKGPKTPEIKGGVEIKGSVTTSTP
jgi:hypothetical protein